jgi:hypothetical protein
VDGILTLTLALVAGLATIEAAMLIRDRRAGVHEAYPVEWSEWQYVYLKALRVAAAIGLLVVWMAPMPATIEVLQGSAGAGRIAQLAACPLFYTYWCLHLIRNQDWCLPRNRWVAFSKTLTYHSVLIGVLFLATIGAMAMP